MKISIKIFLLIFFSFAFCLFTFYLSCERDFSSIGKKPVNPPPNGADTTSHNFVWTIDTFGVGGRGSSYLLDVSVINENDIWAVGEIHTAETDTFDSLGNWVPPYNAVHWNGQEWELKRILFRAFCTHGSLFPSRARSVFAFDRNNVFISSGSQITHWNGNSQTRIDCIPVSVNKIWGTGADDIYVVGTLGKIAHYDGSNWQELNSGTTVDIQDIWGAKNPQSGEWEILAVASFSIGVPQAIQLLRIDGTTVSTVQDSGLPLALETIWFVPGDEYFVGGEKIYHTSDITKAWELDTRQPVFYMYSIRGLDANDIIMAGGHGYLSHFNGSTSKLYSGAELPEFFGNYYSVAVHPNVVAAVGSYGGTKGVVAMGRRSTPK